jgi:hypothetical protein
MKVYANYNGCTASFDVTLFQVYGGQRAAGLPVDIIYKSIEPNELLAGPTFRFAPETAEALFQALWDAGLRPAKGQGGAAEVEALKNHVAFAERIAGTLVERFAQPPVVINHPMAMSPTL